MFSSVESSGSEYDDEPSSSEYEEENISQVPIEPLSSHEAQPKNATGTSLVRWFVIFICAWQTLFNISNRAIEMFLHFFGVLFKVLGTVSASPLIIAIATTLPVSLYLLRKYVRSEQNDYIPYVVCPSCFSLYKFVDCFEEDGSGERLPRRCTFVQFENHPHHHRRLPCNSHLLRKVHLNDGKVIYCPKYVYAYQPLKQSFARLVKRHGFTEKLEHWRFHESKENTLSDIYDGQVWKDFNSPKFGHFLQNKRCVGVMLNFDFFQPYKHVKDSYGVLYLSVMNLPRLERFKQENILLLGILPSFEHEPPSLNTFLEPFVNELKEFWNPGIRLYTAESPKFRLLFRIALMCVACDIPAARKCCGFKGHNANLGCSRCAKYFPGGFGSKNYGGFNRDTWPLRELQKHKDTCKQLKQCNTKAAVEAIETKSGIKYSVLTELTYFNPIRFTIIDPMHNLFLGTAKTVLKKVWLPKGLITEQQFKLLQTRVDAMTVPSDIGRIPRKIMSSFGGFTAEQWKNWIVVYSMFALRGVLQQQDYVCWQTFVLACFFLCRRTITSVDLMKADLLLIKFCHNVERLYGTSTITPNMHLHGHLAECVKDYGSIYGFWLFAFERYNGTLGSFPTNKKSITEQLMRRFIYESECHHLALPEIFVDQFQHILPFANQSRLSEVHQPSNSEEHFCFIYDPRHVHLPSISKYSSLGPSDFRNLASMYTHLYQGSTITDEQMTYSIRVFKNIQFYGRRLGSLKSPKTKRSAYIMASWADENCSINEHAKLRPGKVLYYIMHKIVVDCELKEHLLACVCWYTEHNCCSLYGKPLEIWNNTVIFDGPAFFIPVQKIACRCAVSLGRIPAPTGEDQVLFVSPLPDLQLHFL